MKRGFLFLFVVTLMLTNVGPLAACGESWTTASPEELVATCGQRTSIGEH